MRRLPHAALAVASVLAASACAGGATGRGPLQAGQTRTFPHARAGETIVCVGKDGSIRLGVPRQTPGGNTDIVGFDGKLELTIGPLRPLSPVHHGGVTASCKAR